MAGYYYCKDTKRCSKRAAKRARIAASERNKWRDSDLRSLDQAKRALHDY